MRNGCCCLGRSLAGDELWGRGCTGGKWRAVVVVVVVVVVAKGEGLLWAIVPMMAVREETVAVMMEARDWCSGLMVVVVVVVA